MSGCEKNGASWSGQGAIEALYCQDFRTLEYIRDNYTRCFCGESSVIAYKGCPRHTKFRVPGGAVVTPEQNFGYFVDCEMWQMVNDLYDSENMDGIDFLCCMGYVETQESIEGNLRDMCQSCPEGVMTAAKRAVQRGFSLNSRELCSIYYVALGGVITGDVVTYKYELDLELAQFAYANDCPLPEGIDCSLVVTDVEFLRWFHFNAGVPWDERTTAAAAEHPDTYDSLKFAISNGCPVSSDFAVMMISRGGDIAGWLIRRGLGGESAVKKSRK